MRSELLSVKRDGALAEIKQCEIGPSFSIRKYLTAPFLGTGANSHLQLKKLRCRIPATYVFSRSRLQTIYLPHADCACMERLRQSDLQSLLEFVQECYAFRQFRSFDSFAPELVASCVRLIPSAHTMTYNEMNPEKGESRNCINVMELAAPKWDRLWEHHMHEHPVLIHILETGDHQAMRISDFLSMSQFRHVGLHYEFYRLCDINDVLCMSIPFPPPRVIGLAWHSDRKFTDRERLLGDLASPHISQAWHNARLVSRWRGQLRVLEQGFENLDAGVILCGPKGRVQFTNAQARRYLAEYAGVKRQIDHQLPDDLLRWVRTQELSLSRIDDAPPVRSPLVLETAGKRLVIRLLSKPGAHMILMEEEKTGPSVGAFTSFGLTAREAEVLTWIAQGKTNREIAAILGMQTGTVKKHVEHIFEKLGVETRTAAATQALANSQQEPNS